MPGLKNRRVPPLQLPMPLPQTLTMDELMAKGETAYNTTVLPVTRPTVPVSPACSRRLPAAHCHR